MQAPLSSLPVAALAAGCCCCCCLRGCQEYPRLLGARETCNLTPSGCVLGTATVRRPCCCCWAGFDARQGETAGAVLQTRLLPLPPLLMVLVLLHPYPCQLSAAHLLLRVALLPLEPAPSHDCCCRPCCQQWHSPSCCCCCCLLAAAPVHCSIR